MITETQKIEIKQLAATKPLQYNTKPTVEELRADCVSYAFDFYPQWSVGQVTYFYEMVKSYTDLAEVA